MSWLDYDRELNELSSKKDTSKKQIDILARYILENFPNMIKSGGAVETAIWIMECYKLKLIKNGEAERDS